MNTAQLLNFLHTAFIVCLVIGIVFIVIAIMLFFVLNIRQVFNFKTGRASKKGIREIEEKNFQTGRLSRETMIHKTYENTDSLDTSQDLGKTEQMPNNTYGGATVQTAATDEMYDNGTTVLNAGETTILNAGETTVLSGGTGMAAGQSATRKYVITKKQMYIHTDECI